MRFLFYYSKQKFFINAVFFRRIFNELFDLSICYNYIFTRQVILGKIYVQRRKIVNFSKI